MPVRPLLAALLALSSITTACRKAEVTAYRVPKESVPAAAPATGAPAPGGMANTAVATASGSGLTWKAPEHWKNKPGSAMRKGSYAVTGEAGKDLDISITAFPGNVGGDLANLNRWREQIKLPPITEAEFRAAATAIEAGGLRLTVVDIAGSNASGAPEGILGAMVPYEGSTWFFKAQGPLPLIEREKSAFMAFLKTVGTSTNPAP